MGFIGNSKAIDIPAHYGGFEHVLADIDPAVKPDLLIDARELSSTAPGQFDAVYCSHNLEHFYAYHVAKVLCGFYHVLKDDGFAEVRVPDLAALMRRVVDEGLDLDDVLYKTAAGYPIAARDVIYGWRHEIERSGHDYYAHKTGFTPTLLQKALNLAGFPVVIFRPGRQLEIFALAFKVIPTAFQAGLDGLHGEPYLAQYLSTWISDNDFARSMMSCPEADEGTMSIGKEGECVWAKVGARSFDQDRTQNNIGIDETATNISGGVQVELAEDWHLGFGARYEHVASTIDCRAKTKGDRFSFAGSLKGRFGDTTLATVLTGGFGAFDTTRFINLPGIALTANGEQDVTHAGVHARLAHSFTQGGWYVRPILDAGATYINLGALSETGAGNVGLRVGSNDGWIYFATPALELGGEFTHASGVTVRPYIRAGVTLLSDDSISHTTSFLGAPVGVDPFRISTEFDNVFATLEAGVDIIGGDGLNLKLNYDGKFGEHTRVHAGGLKLGIKF